MAGAEEGAGGPAEEAPSPADEAVFPAEVESEVVDEILQELKHHRATLAAGNQFQPTTLALQSLSSFFSRVTDQMSSKSTILSLESVVPLWTEDVMRLNAWLHRELDEHTRFLSDEHSFDTSGLLSSTELTTQTLRCCIRILPLIDCCNTGLSAQCAASVKSILQQLCSPSTLKSLDHRVDLICGMLEVYMDELLSNPDLSEVFLWTQDEEDRGALSFNRQMQVVLEAACVHALLSWQRIHVPQKCLDTAEQLRVIPTMTLTAAVMLLDMVADEGAPLGFLTHIVNLVRRSIDTHGIAGERSQREVVRCKDILELVLVADPAKTSSWFQDEVNQSMHYRTQGPDLGNTLHPRVCLHLCLSILESAVQLYSQVLETESHLYQHGDLGSVLSMKVGGIFSESLFSVPEMSVGDDGPCCGCSCSSHPRQAAEVCSFPFPIWKDYHLDGTLFRGFQEGCSSAEQTEDFVAAVWCLISSALYRIAAELHKMKHPSATSGHLQDELAREIQITLSCISNVFQSSLPILHQKSPAGKYSVSGIMEESIILDVEDSMRCTWNVLSGVVRSEIQRGITDHLLDVYFHVLKSLVVLVREGTGHETPNEVQTDSAADNAHSKELSPLSFIVESDKDSQSRTGSRQLLTSISPAIAEVRTQMSPATLKIFQKLKGRKPQMITSETGPIGSERECRVSCDQEEVAPSSTPTSQEGPNKRKKEVRDVTRETTSGNPYVQSCIASDKSLDGDSFEDLNDFIVCKKGRNYVKWKKERQKYVKRKRARTIWRRMEEREKLLAKLALTEIQ